MAIRNRTTMKTFTISICSALLLCLTLLSSNASAQDKAGFRRTLSLELFGPSGAAGVSFDSRFTPGSPFGYRLGLGWGYTTSTGLFGPSSSRRSYTIPMEVNYLQGGKRSKLELGFGVDMGLHNMHYGTLEIAPKPDAGEGDPSYSLKTKYRKENKFGYFFYTTVGYRLVTRKRFELRAGVLPVAFNFEEGFQASWLYPYFSFGWSL